MNISSAAKKTSSKSIAIVKNLNDFKSQSAQEHSEFLDNYHKNKSKVCNYELHSNIADLNRHLTDKLAISSNSREKLDDQTTTTTTTKSQMNSVLSNMGSSVSSYLTTNLNRLFQYKNTSCSSDSSSGIDVLHSSDQLTDDRSTIGADSTSYQDIELTVPDAETSPCSSDSVTVSNQIHRVESTENIEESASRRKKSSNIQIKTHRHDDDFTFLPEQNFSAMSYEVLSKSEGSYIDNTVHMKEFIHSTLEEQLGKCANCDQIISKKARRCFYFGKLYCCLCHLNHKFVIPARVLKDFNTKSYPVCENAYHILEGVYRRPIFDILYDNLYGDLYLKSSLLNDCKKLRLELEHLRWYLQTCQNKDAKNVFIMHLWPDDYLYETIHLYSLYDLYNLKDIYTKLRSARDYGVNHVLKECDLCTQKGFICEICKNDTTIYPFQLDIVIQCPDCGSLVHKTCRTTDTNECLKCKRLNNRH